MSTIKLMVDSGAFSAWKRDMTLDLKQYIKYIKRNKDIIYSYVNMDVIPGSKGRMIRTPQSVEQSAKLSYENLQHMKDAGLSPIPVFHQGESFVWLERLMNDKEPYIGISPYLKAHRNTIVTWLDRCFKITKKTNTHGFGVTQQGLLARNQWFSTDSTAWLIQSAYGHIFVPTFRSGKMDFSKPQRLKVSTQESCSGYEQFGCLSKMERDCVAEYYSKIGVDIFSASNLARVRQRVNLLFFEGLAKQLNIKIFHSAAKVHTSVKLMNQMGVNHRLISYFDLMDEDPNALERYTNGEYKTPAKRITKANWKRQSYLNIRYANLIERMKP